MLEDKKRRENLQSPKSSIICPDSSSGGKVGSFEESLKLYKGHMLDLSINVDRELSIIHQRCLHFNKTFHALDRIAICAPRGGTKSVTQTAHSGKEFVNTSHTVAIKPDGLSIAVTSKTLIYDDFVLLLAPALFFQLAKEEGHTEAKVRSFLSEIRILPRSEWMKQLLHQLFHRAVISGKLQREDLRFFIKLIVKEVFEIHDPSNSSESSNSLPFEKILERIETQLFSKLAVSELASEFGMGASTLNRVFIKFTGISPQQFILRRKLELADEILNDSNKTVGEVAHLTGYDSTAAFSKAYKKHFGYPPRKKPPL